MSQHDLSLDENGSSPVKTTMKNITMKETKLTSKSAVGRRNRNKIDTSDRSG